MYALIAKYDDGAPRIRSQILHDNLRKLSCFPLLCFGTPQLFHAPDLENKGLQAMRDSERIQNMGFDQEHEGVLSASEEMQVLVQAWLVHRCHRE